MVLQLQGKFTNRRRQQLAYYALVPSGGRPRAVALFLHGLGEHARRFAHVFARLAASGVAVLSYDLVAHGESDCDAPADLRGHGERFEHFVDDSNALLSLTKLGLLAPQLPAESDQDPFPPLVLMGISFGGLVAMHTALSGCHAVHAAVLASPAVAVELTPTLRLQQLASKPLVWLLPRARLVPGVNHAALTRDPEFLRDYLDDPLNVTDNLTTTMATQILAGMQRMQRDPRVRDPNSDFCRVPLLIVQGTSDHVTSVPELERFFNDVLASRDKTLERFEGLFHCIFNEPEKEQVLDVIVKWLDERLTRRETAVGVQWTADGQLLADKADAPRLQARL